MCGISDRPYIRGHLSARKPMTLANSFTIHCSLSSTVATALGVTRSEIKYRDDKIIKSEKSSSHVRHHCNRTAQEKPRFFWKKGFRLLRILGIFSFLGFSVQRRPDTKLRPRKNILYAILSAHRFL